MRYASLLHDFGKVGVREPVLVKAEKLYPHELEVLRARFELARKDRQLAELPPPARRGRSCAATQRAGGDRRRGGRAARRRS